MAASLFEPRNGSAPHLSWSLAQSLTAARFVEWCLQDFGVRIPPENRLQRAAQIVETGSETPWEDLSLDYRLQLSEAARTLMEQYLIVRAIIEPNKALKERLRWLLKGDVRPNRKSSTHPYDVQFELFAGTALIHAGIHGVRLEEPDWRIRAGEREVGVAAKRVSSIKNYTKLVRDAIRQIRRQGCPGVIVLNFDALCSTDVRSEAASRVTALVKEARELVRSVEAEEVIFCLFGFATSFQVLSSAVGGTLGMEVFTHGEVIEPDLSHAGEIKVWFSRIGGSIIRSVDRAMREMPTSVPGSEDTESRN
jgi:hypothetical protein